MARDKEFEAEVSRSLRELPGMYMRIEDGGKVAKNKQLGDFLYWEGDVTHLIECKVTKEKSFPLKNIQEHQLASLLDFYEMSRLHHSWVAINYYSDEDKGRAFVISVPSLLMWQSQTDRKSLPIHEAEVIGNEVFMTRKEGKTLWSLTLRSESL